MEHDRAATTPAKEVLRGAFLRRRGALSASEMRDASERLVHRVSRWRPWELARGVAGYTAFRSEIDPSGLLSRALASSKRVYLPRVEGDRAVEFVRIEQLDALQPGAYGILEPTGPACDLGEIELFLVPGVAFGPLGGRLGFGEGFYDRVLRRRMAREEATRARFVGVCYDWQVVDAPLPTEAHDVAMDVVATDRRLIDCGLARGAFADQT